MRKNGKITALITEVLGTAILSSAVLAVILRTSFPMFPAMAAGIVYVLMYLGFVKYSGAHLNPALTLGLWVTKQIPLAQALAYISAQLVGGYSALTFNAYLMGEALPQLSVGSIHWQVFLSETAGAFVFVFAMVAAVYQRYVGGYLAALAGLSVAAGMLIASIASNGLINPALAIGVNSWSLSYVLGPLLGGVLGAAFYTMIYAPQEIRQMQKNR